MSKIVPAAIGLIVLFGIVEAAFVARPVSASVAPTTLGMATWEDVFVSEDGSSQISILMNVSSGPLADMYRKVLAAPVTVGTEEEVPIPENATQNTDPNGNVTDVSMPVREYFYESIAKEQLLSLGLRMEIIESGMVPRGGTNECRIMINALGSFEVFNVTNDGPNQTWEVGFGPFNTTGITGLVLTRLMFAQMMLGSIPGFQVYQDYWHVRVSLPPKAVLLNQGSSYSWTIDFGGGTYLDASVSLQDTAAISIDENIVITENNVTATPEYLANTFSTYKTFRIKYSLAGTSTAPNGNQEGSLNTNWSHESDTDWVTFPDIPLPLSYADSSGNSLDLRLTISPKLRVADYIGWQFFYDLNFPFVHLDRFWALMNFSASIGVKLEANATLVLYENSWRLFYLRLTYATAFYGVPLWIDVDFTIDANLYIKGNMSFVAKAVINGEIDTGVTWDHARTNNGRLGWDEIYTKLASANVTDFTWQLVVDILIKPGMSFRIEFLFYSVAGPFVEFEPYLSIEETLVLPNATILWNMSLYFDINAGVTFKGWLSNILGLSDWNFFEQLQNLWHYDGSWNLGPQPSPHEATHNLQVASLEMSPPVIVANNGAIVNVTVRNTGDYNETSDIILSENDSVIDSQNNINFTSGESLVFSFNWNSAILPPGSYVLKALATPVEAGENEADNEMNTTVQIVANNDIAIVDVRAEPNRTYLGRTVNVTVVIKNLGDLTEDSNVTLSANDTTIYTHTVNQLALNQSIALVFQWDTTGLDRGQYAIWANASTLHYDINIANNNLTNEGNLVDLRILGDIDGDGKVNILDVVNAGNAFGSRPRDSNWNQMVDLNSDDTINILDMIIIAHNFGRTH